MTKLTEQAYLKSFMDKGYTPLTPFADYKTSKTLVELECPKHGRVQNTFFNVRYNKYGCPVCAKEAHYKKPPKWKHTTESINNVIKEAGLIPVDDFVWDGTQKTVFVQFECPKHGRQKVRWSNFTQKKRCPRCGREQRDAGAVNSDNEKVLRELLKKRDFEIIGSYEKPLIQTTKVQVRCTKDSYEFETSINGLKKNGGRHGCLRCAGLESLDWAEYLKKIENAGRRLIGDPPEHFNQVTPITAECVTCGNVKTFTAAMSCRCTNCEPRITDKWSEEKARSFLKEKNYTLLSSYTGFDSLIHLSCEKGHTWWTKLKAIRYENTPCPSCRPPYSSLGEGEVAEYVASIIPDEIIRNNKDLIDMELDIVVLDRNVAIEYNGLYYHNERVRSSGYHQEKLNAVEKLNMQLLNIWDFEWNEKQDIVKHLIAETLNVYKFIKKGKCRDVRKKDAQVFLNENTLNGDYYKTNCLGLYDDTDTLIALMTLREKNQKIYIQYHTKLGYGVPTGFQMLFNHVLEYARGNFKEVVGIVDLRWSQGKYFRKAGFSLDSVTQPDYFLSQNGKFVDIDDTGMSKTERYEKGFARVYDCGKKRWVFKL